MQIRLPRWARQPTWVTRGLDAYSGWAEVDTGPNLRILGWRYRVRRMDFVSIGMMLALGTGIGWWYVALGGEFWKGFLVVQAMGVVSWVWLEYVVPRG